jgi:hypothetical protein
LCMCLACDRDQAKIVLGYVKSYFTDNPMLRALVKRETVNGFELNNGVDVAIATNSFRSVRGRAILLAILDECAFYRDESSATPDIEVYNAVKPGMATLANSMLIGISSPYRKAGLLHKKFKDHYGRDGDILVIRAPSVVLNPTLDPAIITEALESDPVAARSEWQAEFRDDIGGWADLALIESAVDGGVTVRPPVSGGGVRYTSFCDLSGGVRDSSTAAVCHAIGNVAVVDCLVEVKAPHNPVVATKLICDVLSSYGLRETTADKYSAGFAVDAFAKNGIKLRHSEQDRSTLYLECLPLLASGRARLLDNRRLLMQFASLERRTSPIGKDRVGHGIGGSDDLANAVAGGLVNVFASAKKAPLPITEKILARSRMPARSGQTLMSGW